MAAQDDERRTEPRTLASPTRTAHEPALPEEGSVVDGKYRVERTLGSGGMGVVVAAMHLELGERVALKFVKVAEPDADLVERLRREARITFRLRSQHVARLLDVGTLPSGAPYLVLEHLTGKDVARALAERGRLPVAEAVDWVLQACDAIAESHRLGVVHRDLKPSNMFLTRGVDGAPLVKVLDFGVAKALGQQPIPDHVLTTTSSIVGSPLYMSPEQVRGAKHVDARSDIWALGVILHELVTGKTPFGVGPASAVCAAIAADEPARLREHQTDAPEALERIVLRCLQKDPARRYPTVGALAEALAPLATEASAGTLLGIAKLSRASLPDASSAADVTVTVRPSGRHGAADAEAETIASDDADRAQPALAVTARTPSNRGNPRLWALAGVVVIGVAAFLVARASSPPARAPAGDDSAAQVAPPPATAAATAPDPASATASGAPSVTPEPLAESAVPAAAAPEPAPSSRPAAAAPRGPVVRRHVGASATSAPSPSAQPVAAPPAQTADLEQRATSRRR